MTPFDPELILKEGARVRTLARDLVHGAADVDDLVQETWLRALQKPPRVGFSWRAWLAGLTRNVARERRRAERRRASHEKGARPQAPSDDDPADVAARFELLRRLLGFVDELAEPQRTTLLRRYFDGLEPVEIARREGIPDATVRSRLKRGLDELRTRLDATHDGERSQWMAALLPWSRPAATVAAGGAAIGIGGLLVKSMPAGLVTGFALLVVTVVGGRVWWTRSREMAPIARHASTTESPPDRPAPGVPVAKASHAERSSEPLGHAPGEASDAPSDAADSAAAVTEWRLEGVLRGLDPAIPWTGTIRVRAMGPSLSGEDALLFTARLEADGTFSSALPGLAPREGRPSHCRGLRIEAEDPAYVDAEGYVDALDRQGSGATPVPLRVALDTRPAARIHGRVIDERGRPVMGARVSWSEASGSDERVAKSDQGGRYQLKSAALGPTSLHCWGAQCGVDDRASPAPSALDEFLPLTTAVDLRAGVDLLVPDLVLHRGTQIRGIVVDATGDPMAGAIVAASPADGTATSTPRFALARQTISSELGEFILSGLAPGAWRCRVVGWRGIASHPGIANTRTFGTVEFDAPTDDVELVCRVCRVEILVRLDGQPVAAAAITVMGTSVDGNGSVLGGTTSSQGRFEFAALPGWKYHVNISRPDVEGDTPPFTLPDDATEKAVTLDLMRRRPRASFTLALHDPSGRPVARAWFKLTPNPPSNANSSDFNLDSDDSTFHLKEIEPGEYHVVVRAGGGHFGCGGFFVEEEFDVALARAAEADGRAEVVEPKEVVRTVDLHPTGRLRVATLDPGGKGVSCSCRLLTRDGRPLSVEFTREAANLAMSSGDGTMDEPSFVTPPPRPGRYRLEFQQKGCAPESVATEVVAGQTTDVVFTVKGR